MASIGDPWFSPHSSSSLAVTNKTGSRFGAKKTEWKGWGHRTRHQRRQTGKTVHWTTSRGQAVSILLRTFSIALVHLVT